MSDSAATSEPPAILEQLEEELNVSEHDDDPTIICEKPKGPGPIKRGKYKGYYYVDSICGHKTTSKGLKLQVKWKGWTHDDDDTWELEANLDGSIRMLDAYCKAIEMSATELR